MTRLVLLCALLAPAGAAQVYDLLLKNGNVIDPANHRGGRMDVAVIGNKIARVAPDLPAAHARVVIDASQYYVTPGLVDIHTHFNWAAGGSNLLPDYNALPNGVTTAVDAGSSGWRNFEEFQSTVIAHAKTRMLAFLSVESDPDATSQMVRKHRDTIVGVQTAASPDSVDRAVKAAELSRSIMMVDLHQKPGGEYPELTRRMRPGDIYTHAYSRPMLPSLGEARQRGVLFDVGHGAAGFWFRIAVPAIRQGFLPDTISTDIDRDSVMLPRATMTNVMSKFLNIGMTLEQVVERSTLNPARAIHRPDLGTLGEGAIADIAVLELQKGSFGFLDSGHGKLVGDRRLRCVITVRNGAIVWDSEGLSAPDWMKAGPYSNFK